jgi:hypothetical protein
MELRDRTRGFWPRTGPPQVTTPTLNGRDIDCLAVPAEDQVRAWSGGLEPLTECGPYYSL